MLKLNEAINSSRLLIAATFGWLCVETANLHGNITAIKAATFGWLCVETSYSFDEYDRIFGSHLRVAVC